MGKNDVREMQGEHYDDQEEGRVVTTGQVFALQSAEIDQAIATARRYPRSLTDFRRTALEQVTHDPVIAAQCTYQLERKDKDGRKKIIEGPSVRFTEVIQQSWGNNRVASRVIDIGDEFVTVQGLFFDVQNNNAVTFEVVRSITTRGGDRYSTDMIGVTTNAASSIALRNAIQRGIPKAFWGDIHAEAKRCAAGDVKTLNARRANLVTEFGTLGVKPEQIFQMLDVPGIEDIGLDHLVTMGAVLTAIKDGDTSVEEAFAIPGTMTPPRPRQSEFDRGGGNAGGGGVATDRPATGGNGKPANVGDGGTIIDAKATVVDERVDVRADPRTGEVTTEPSKADAVMNVVSDTRAFQLEWYAEQKAALAKIERVRDVSALHDQVATGLYDEQLKEWEALCDRRVRDIMEASKRKA